MNDTYKTLMGIGLSTDSQLRASIAFGYASRYAETSGERATAVIQHVTALGCAEEHLLAYVASMAALEGLADYPAAETLVCYMATLSCGALGRFEDGLALAKRAWPGLDAEHRAKLTGIYPNLENSGAKDSPSGANLN